ncbi:hypothetical protein DH2020_026050 [Rehmannia glutinosa]|uniref:CCHC-type domain-containing protein n=1 Tax=Rehmannia glutinosa TaxID=99300 RepID=A0ABR0VY43_REHGL
MADDITTLYANLSLNEEENTTIPLDASHLNVTDGSLCLVGKILSSRIINFDSIAAMFKRLWSPRHGLSCKPLGDNSILFQFRNRVDKQKVIAGSPWLFDKALLALSEVSGTQIGSQLEIKTCPFWIQVHNTPLGLMNRNFATTAANTIGSFIALDVDSEGLAIGRFLRIRVNLDISKPLRRVIKASLNGTDYILPIKYERLPNFCYFCGIIGHGDRECESRLLTPAVIEKFKRSLNFHGISVDARGRSGGLALLWHKDTSVTLRSFSDRFIDVDVELLGKLFRLTGVYGEPNVNLRRQSWNNFKNLATTPESPWIICGDFNEVLTQKEFQGSHPRALWQMELFRNTLQHLNMFDLGYEGSPFTWSRLLTSPHTQRARLDRATCNSIRMTSFHGRESTIAPLSFRTTTSSISKSRTVIRTFSDTTDAAFSGSRLAG